MIVFGKPTIGAPAAPFLIKMVEHEDNEIEFVVAMSVCDEKGTDGHKLGNSKLDDLLLKAIPIHADRNDLYEIVFEDYVFLMTRNESYTYWDEYEIRLGDFFVLFEKSRLLDYLTHIVDIDIVNAYYPQGYKHYGIYCQNHIIDVIATKEPRIKRICGTNKIECP